MKKILFFVILVAIFIVAAVKNPSEAQAKEMIYNKATEMMNEKVDKSLDNNGLGALSSLAGALVQSIAPSVLKTAINVEVDDYVFFSTFSATSKMLGDKSNIASGIILFGKIIPLKSDYKD